MMKTYSEEIMWDDRQIIDMDGEPLPEGVQVLLTNFVPDQPDQVVEFVLECDDDYNLQQAYVSMGGWRTGWQPMSDKLTKGGRFIHLPGDVQRSLHQYYEQASRDAH
jgi:hypothetical protein